MMRSRWRLTVLTATLLLGGVVPLRAQAADSPNRQDRSRLEERIRARMGEIIRERLELDEVEAEQLSSIAREFERRRRDLAREERATRSEARALVEPRTPDEGAAVALLDRFVELRIREAELVRQEQERLQEVLTAGQILQLYELRAEIGRRIRAIRGRAGQQGPRSGPGPLR